MTLSEVMAELEEFGTEQNRKIYRRHGSGENLFGVSFANLNVLKKKIKTDHTLAIQLWGTGNVDAQTLATMIVDAKQVNSDLLESWLKDARYYMLVDVLVSNVAAKTRFLQTKMEQWTGSDDEWVGRAGWTCLAHLAMNDKYLPDDYFEDYLHTIEKNIHKAKNRTREAMNSALIAIGLRNADLKEQALATAEVIGTVEVDHGDTSCKTPDAEEYILKGWERKGKKK